MDVKDVLVCYLPVVLRYDDIRSVMHDVKGGSVSPKGGYLQNVVVDDAEGFGYLLGEREDLREVLVWNLVHPRGMV